jgi:hypothetical protein
MCKGVKFKEGKNEERIGNLMKTGIESMTRRKGGKKSKTKKGGKKSKTQKRRNRHRKTYKKKTYYT